MSYILHLIVTTCQLLSHRDTSCCFRGRLVVDDCYITLLLSLSQPLSYVWLMTT
ncbi:hypothetical protein ORF055 [Yersinia phage PYps49T]|nr:hypothetical protein ORF055 [Yersinia phage PYps49T]